MMLETFMAAESIIDRDLISKHEGTIEFVEKKKEGQCCALFDVGGLCIKMVPHQDRHPISWLLQKQCADGAFLTEIADGLHLHLVELKSRIGIETWDSVRGQFAGMFWNAWAFTKFIDLPEIKQVSCYLVYTRDALRLDRTASPTLIRVFPEKYILAAEEWKEYKVSLPRNFIAPLVRKIKSESLIVDFGSV